jgi:hypothetical protein
MWLAIFEPVLEHADDNGFAFARYHSENIKSAFDDGSVMRIK